MRLRLLGLALLAMALVGCPVQAQEWPVAAGPAIATGDKTSRPIGHIEFCKARPEECAANTVVEDQVALTDELATQLALVNAAFNASIRAVPDAEFYGVNEFWTYPDQAGDCEDFALAKRRALQQAGWPASTLLIAVVRQTNGAGHAVLMVRTSRGDMVLDNLDADVHLWNELPYVYVKRQSQANAGDWVTITDDRSVQTVASPH